MILEELQGQGERLAPYAFDAQLYRSVYIYATQASRIGLLPSLAVQMPNIHTLAVSILTDAIDTFDLRYSCLPEGYDGTIRDEATFSE